MKSDCSSLLIQSLTQKEANDLWNLERMEFLGDSFLKIGVTRSIYDDFPQQTAGQFRVRNLKFFLRAPDCFPIPIS